MINLSVSQEMCCWKGSMSGGIACILFSVLHKHTHAHTHTHTHTHTHAHTHTYTNVTFSCLRETCLTLDRLYRGSLSSNVDEMFYSLTYSIFCLLPSLVWRTCVHYNFSFHLNRPMSLFPASIYLNEGRASIYFISPI